MRGSVASQLYIRCLHVALHTPGDVVKDAHMHTQGDVKTDASIRTLMLPAIGLPLRAPPTQRLNLLARADAPAIHLL
jgi:hypothetical protein